MQRDQPPEELLCARCKVLGREKRQSE